MKKQYVSGSDFEIVLNAERFGITFNQRYTNLHDYLVKAQELEQMGFKIVSWYDRSLLGRLS